MSCWKGYLGECVMPATCELACCIRRQSGGYGIAFSMLPPSVLRKALQLSDIDLTHLEMIAVDLRHTFLLLKSCAVALPATTTERSVGARRDTQERPDSVRVVQ